MALGTILGLPRPHPVRTTARRRAATVAVLVVGLTTLLPGGTFGPPPASAAPAFSRTETIKRTHLKADGTEMLADSRTFSVSVSQTTQLRAQQQVTVQWSGAHPSLGIVSDPSSKNAHLQEYPVVLMQCRGNDTPGNPVDPSACWTQFIDQRQHQTYSSAFPPWRVDRYADAADRQPFVGYPSPLPSKCFMAGLAGRYVPFLAADQDHTAYRPVNPDSGECGPVRAPEMTDVPSDSPPANTTFAVTNADGTGSAKFVIWTDQENGSLGCSTSVACSLVVIPIMGMSCDLRMTGLPDSDATACQASGRNGIHQLMAPGQAVDDAVTGEFWWSTSNWQNRVVVPLGLGTPGNVCDSGDNRIPLDIFGSELMSQATIQWAPAFCLDPARFKFRHVRLSEPQAKSALDTGGAEAALVTQPPPAGYQKPTVNAPIAVTGFAVSYSADQIQPDGTAGDEYHNLRLNARLLAKLMAESYVPSLALRDEYHLMTVPPDLPDNPNPLYDPNNPYAAMQYNPIDLSNDPEFIALNPGVGNHNVDAATSATVLAISASSDVMSALTSYLNADPEARAWLDGRPDPWGMVVNPGYRGIALPQQTWPLSDTFVAKSWSPYGCLPSDHPDLQKSVTQVPYLPMVASPLPSLATVAQRVQFALSNAHINCHVVLDVDNNPVGVQMLPPGRQGPGHRLMLGVTSLADARFFQLSTAALQSTATVSDPTAKFTDANNRTFVAPTDDSMKAAIALAKPDATQNVWTMPYDTMRGSTGAQAYPGTMPVYLSVPTKGVPAEDAAHLAQLIRFGAGDGQTPGTANGQLPPGYLPMTAANGMAGFVAFAGRAADAVAAQAGQIPLVTGGFAAQPSTDPGGGGAQPGGGPVATATGVPNAGAPVAALPSASPSATPKGSAAPRSAGLTAALLSTLGRWALPTVLFVGLGASLAGLGTRTTLAVTAWSRRRRR